MDLRVTDVACGVREDRPDLPGPDVVDAQLAAGVHRERRAARVGRIVGDIGVPVAVDAGLAHGEQDFFGQAGVQEACEQRRLFAVGLRLPAPGRRRGRLRQTTNQAGFGRA